MITDLAALNLLDLTLATVWSEEHKKSLLEQYTEALASFLEEKLRSKLKLDQVLQLDELADNPTTSDEVLLGFYKKYIPNIYEVLEQISLEFKKLFLTKLYEKYCMELADEIKHLKQSYEKNNDEKLQHTITERNKSQLRWEHILKLAEEDKWKELFEQINTMH